MDDGGDPLSAALKMSFNGNGKNSYFPGAQRYADAANDISGMLNQSPETQFLAKPITTPSPTPTPTPVKPSQMNLAQLYDHFGVQQPTPSPLTTQTELPNTDHLENMRAQYGWNT